MPIMSRRLDEDDEDIIPSRRPIDQTAEREVSLGTGAILGSFFGLVLLLGAFFGFGYKLGSSTAKNAIAAGGSDSGQPTGTASSGGAKPSAGSLPGATPNVVVKDGAPVLTAPTGVPATTSHTAPAAQASTADDEPAPAAVPAPVPVALSKPAAPTPAPVPVAVPVPMPQTSATGTYVVQVAAISHQEDANLLVNALRARGYNVNAHTESGDRLVHIQVGPFSTKKDAEAMKARLSADGYNPFIK